MAKEHFIFKEDRSLLVSLSQEMQMDKVLFIERMDKFRVECGKITFWWINFDFYTEFILL